MKASASALLRCHSLVACNIYVSAGKPRYAGILTDLLDKAQRQCKDLRNVKGGDIAIVHAFADGPYDRSSFHLAGGADNVATVASSIATEAVRSLVSTVPENTVSNNNTPSRHPFVGLVDHISVMPLGEEFEVSENHSNKNKSLTNHDFVPASASGWAARCIGNSMKNAGVEVYFYGTAHPDGTSLATVRRERTSFFKSGGLERSTSTESQSNPAGVSTIGAPSTFVENFNIRLTSKCNRKVAQTLTRAVRERDGGLKGVEALTLPYSDNRYEVACNLLRPDVGSSDAILKVLNKWVQSNELVLSLNSDKDQILETAYRVGTTADQCRSVLSNKDALDDHDAQVMIAFKGYLNS